VSQYTVLQTVEGAKSISIGGYGVEDQTIAWKENFSLYDFIFSASAVNSPDFLTNLLRSRIDLKRYNIETGDFTGL